MPNCFCPKYSLENNKYLEANIIYIVLPPFNLQYSLPFLSMNPMNLSQGMAVGAQLRSQPILRWAIAQLRIRNWVAHLKMG